MQVIQFTGLMLEHLYAEARTDPDRPYIRALEQAGANEVIIVMASLEDLHAQRDAISCVLGLKNSLLCYVSDFNAQPIDRDHPTVRMILDMRTHVANQMSMSGK